MHGNYTAVTSMQERDLLIALGSRFDDRVTGKVPAFAPDAKIIHVDIDPAELGKVRRPDVGIAGDCRWSSRSWSAPCASCSAAAATQPDRPAWKSHDRGWQETLPAHLRAVRAGRAAQAAVRARDSCATTRPTTPSWRRASASTRCGPASTGSSTTRTPGSTPVASAPWASRCRRRSAPRSVGPTAWCGRSTATAASR